MSDEAVQNPRPGRRRAPERPAEVQPGQRRSLKRAWDATRERLSETKFPTPKKPTRKTLYWIGGVLAALGIVIAILIAIWDWNWFRGPLERIASARTHREVQINGDLNVNIWSWQPWATVDDVTIANPAWAGTAKMGTFGRITVQARLVPLLWGRLDLRQLRFDRPSLSLHADAQGRKNWDFSDGRVQEPLNLPPIRSFQIVDGHLKYRDVARKLTFNAAINAHERLGERTRGFELTGKGTMNSQPFQMQVTGGPLVNIERNRPYPFDADIRAGDTYLTARGTVPKPFDLGHFQMVASARGPDLATLFPLTGIALPNTPPYSLRGRLIRDGMIWRVEGFGGRVGDSDLSGDIKVTTGRERPLLEATLLTRNLDFDDLGALFGGAPAIGPGETASPEQRVVARKLIAQQRLFPDTTLDATRLRAIDADVTYKISSIRDAPIKLAGASARVKLDAGLLKANPLVLELPKGRVEGFVNLDGRKAVPATELDLRLTNASIEQLIPIQTGGASPLSGVVVGRARLSGSGNSVHKAFASANGEVMLVAPGGEIRESFAELMGVNVTKGLGLLLSKDQSTVPIRCAVAHFETKGGVMTANNIVFDTGPVLVTGKGTINLATERMDFKVRGKSKKFRLVRALVPITVKGPIMAPKMGVEPGGAIAQAGVALGLGALLTPLAALLPFIDPGLAKDANCGGLIAEARADGAPVAKVQSTAR